MLDRFLRPAQLKTNQDGALLRLIACICMFIDHAGKMLFPQLTWMRLVGRLAFPLFAYGIAVGAAMTKHPQPYITRVAALALVSQPLYAVALGHTNNAMYAVPFAQHPLRALYTFYIKSWETPSILLPLLLGLLLLLCIRERKYIPALLIYVLCERFSGSLDYGVGGIRLMILFYLFLEYPALCFAVTTAYMLVWALDGRGYPIFGVQFGMRLFAVPAVILASLPIRRKTQLPKWLTYGFYPAHLIILLILEKIF
ncbi:MAG: TraX family protein [Christensenellales bacterium]